VFSQSSLGGKKRHKFGSRSEKREDGSDCINGSVRFQRGKKKLGREGRGIGLTGLFEKNPFALGLEKGRGFPLGGHKDFLGLKGKLLTTRECLTNVVQKAGCCRKKKKGEDTVHTKSAPSLPSAS